MSGYYLPIFVILAGCSAEKEAAPSNDAGLHDQSVASQPPSYGASPISIPPRDFKMPDFAPQYPGSTLVSVDSAEAGNRRTHEVRLTTVDNAAVIMTFYRERFAAGGLRKTSDFLSGESGMMSATGEGRKASIAIAREHDRQSIIVTYSGN